MKIRNSLKSLKDRHRDNRVIRRRGRTYVINKTNRPLQSAPGLTTSVFARGRPKPLAPALGEGLKNPTATVTLRGRSQKNITAVGVIRGRFCYGALLVSLARIMCGHTQRKAGWRTQVTSESAQPHAVIFDVGRVLFQWDLRHLFRQLIPDDGELEWFVTHVVSPQWHFQHDAGRDLDGMLRKELPNIRTMPT